MHPDDLLTLGVVEGDTIRLSSSHDAILGIVGSDDSILPGVISMTHAFGGLAGKDDKNLKTMGSNTGRLTPVDKNYDPVTGIPLMSNIPVKVEAFDL